MPNFAENESVVPTVERWLDRSGPMELDEIIDMLEDEGFELGSDPEEFVSDELISTESVLGLTLDERWFNARSLVRDKIFTHKVTEMEVEHDVLAIDPDLNLTQGTEAPESVRLADGAPIFVVFSDYDKERLAERGIPAAAIDRSGSLLLPPRTLQALGVAPGDTIGVRVTREGLDLTRPEPPETGEKVSRFAADLHAAVVDSSPPAQLITVLQTICADEDGYFREPLPPVTDLLEAAKLTREGDWVAPAGFDIAGWRKDTQTDFLIEHKGVTPEEALLVVALSDLQLQLRTSPDQAEAAASSDRATTDQATTPASALQRVLDADPDLLMDPMVAETFHSQALAFSDQVEAVIRLADLLETVVDRRMHPVLLWLKAKAYERAGAVLEAETLLQQIHRLDPTWPLVKVDLARFANDRGDAIGGLALLDQLKVDPFPDLRELLENMRPKAGPSMGRNEPCWCGSGRKFKQCHLNRPAQLPLEDRAAWLYQKAGLFLQEWEWHRAMLRVSSYLVANNGAELSEEPHVADAVMFEGGGFAAFVAHRGELLPDDERLLADQWLLNDRSVFEVESTKPGESISVRDLRTGDRHVVRERTASKALRKGNLMCARIVPAGETMQIFGGIVPLSLQHRDAMMALLDQDPSAEELLGFFSQLNAGPTLTNTEGEPLVWCEAVLRPGDIDRLTARFDQAFDQDDEAATWIENREVDGLSRLVATIRLMDDDLHVDTNSEERMDDLLARLKAWDPAITTVSEEREPMADFAALNKRLDAKAPDGASKQPPAPTPDQLSALAEMILKYEEKWIDDSIPALKGLTPRQAAADPTRRDDLIRLLNSFPSAQGNPGAMDKERLRKALGLPSGDGA